MASEARWSLAGVLGVLAITLTLGFLLKWPCANVADWADGRQATRACYSDVIGLHVGRGLADGLPYRDGRFEYPVGTGLPVAVAAALTTSSTGFFLANVAMLGAAAVVTTVVLHRLTGRRALYFAAAPTLAISAFLNWDLFVVALATLGTAAHLARRPLRAGLWLGLGAATKVYPAGLALLFAGGTERRSRRDGVRLLLAAAAAWVAINLPVALMAPDRWAHFYRFSSARAPTLESTWFLACRLAGGDGFGCWSPRSVNLVSGALLLGGVLLVWRARRRRDPAAPLWTLAFPALVLALLLGKVYSPQFALWILPWFALTLPDLRLFIAFQAIELAGFVARFGYLRATLGEGGLPRIWVEVTSALRVALFVVLVIAWIRGSSTPAIDADRGGTR
jgi:uncharacterized membrane protein